MVPVWQGGGLCGLENLQTLCGACHSAKTRAEAKERQERWREGIFRVGQAGSTNSTWVFRCVLVGLVGFSGFFWREKLGQGGFK